MPTQRLEEGAWLHPARLPLGAGWQGYCTAPGHEGELPAPEELHQGCNLGYAVSCPRLPKERGWDAVRFAVAGEHESGLGLAYVCERNHLPVEHGTLEYRFADQVWLNQHNDPRLQMMAQCFLASWQRRSQTVPPSSAAETENIHEPV